MIATIEVADPKGLVAKHLGLKPGPLRGDEKLTVEVDAPTERVVQQLAEDLAALAQVEKVTVIFK